MTSSDPARRRRHRGLVHAGPPWGTGLATMPARRPGLFIQPPSALRRECRVIGMAITHGNRTGSLCHNVAAGCPLKAETRVRIPLGPPPTLAHLTFTITGVAIAA